MTSKTLTTEQQQRLNEIRTRAEGATSGPWKCESGFGQQSAVGRRMLVNGDDFQLAEFKVSPRVSLEDEFGEEATRNGDFCAHARDDVPWLLDLILELTKETPQDLLTRAKKNGYVFLLQSSEQLLFVKTYMPPISRDGFFAGCSVQSAKVLPMLENGVREKLPICWEGNS